MAKESEYRWTDGAGVDRIVCSIPGTGNLGQVGAVGLPVTDVKDVKTGEHIKAIPWTALKLIESD